MTKASITAVSCDLQETGAPVTYCGFPEKAVIEGASFLSVAIGVDVSPEDYAEAALLFLQVLAMDGLAVLRRLFEIGLLREGNIDLNRCSESVPLSVLEEAYLHGKTQV
jgi:hypothetical protein